MFSDGGIKPKNLLLLYNEEKKEFLEFRFSELIRSYFSGDKICFKGMNNWFTSKNCNYDVIDRDLTNNCSSW